jgi:hypothetical protein
MFSFDFLFAAFFHASFAIMFSLFSLLPIHDYFRARCLRALRARAALRAMPRCRSGARAADFARLFCH